MTTLVPFTPPPNSGFQFTATLDGTQYTIFIAWNLAGQRWYLNVLTLTGTLIWTVAMVGSPDDGDINLIAGYIPTSTSTLVFRETTQTFEISP